MVIARKCIFPNGMEDTQIRELALEVPLLANTPLSYCISLGRAQDGVSLR